MEVQGVKHKLFRCYAMLNVPTHRADAMADIGWVIGNTVPSCLNCEQTFNLWNRKYNCRACGILACGTCITKATLFGYESLGTVLVCPPCDANTNKVNEKVCLRGNRVNWGATVDEVLKFRKQNPHLRFEPYPELGGLMGVLPQLSTTNNAWEQQARNIEEGKEEDSTTVDSVASSLTAADTAADAGVFAGTGAANAMEEGNAPAAAAPHHMANAGAIPQANWNRDDPLVAFTHLLNYCLAWAVALQTTEEPPLVPLNKFLIVNNSGYTLIVVKNSNPYKPLLSAFGLSANPTGGGVNGEIARTGPSRKIDQIHHRASETFRASSKGTWSLMVRRRDADAYCVLCYNYRIDGGTTKVIEPAHVVFSALPDIPAAEFTNLYGHMA